jgi:uncharacterized protein (TIGR00369 family)
VTSAHPDLTPQAVDEFIASVYPAAAKAFRCEEMGTTHALVRWKYDDRHLRPGGLISGPTLFTCADVALWYLSFTQLGLAAMAVTSDVHIDFLRPAKGGDLLARAELLRSGKSRITGRVSIWVDGNEEKPVAHATGNYALLPG